MVVGCSRAASPIARRDNSTRMRPRHVPTVAWHRADRRPRASGRVESRRSAVTSRSGGAENERRLLLPLSPRGPSLRFFFPLIEPDPTISVIRLGGGFHVKACAGVHADKRPDDDAEFPKHHGFGKLTVSTAGDVVPAAEKVAYSGAPRSNTKDQPDGISDITASAAPREDPNASERQLEQLSAECPRTQLCSKPSTTMESAVGVTTTRAAKLQNVDGDASVECLKKRGRGGHGAAGATIFRRTRGGGGGFVGSWLVDASGAPPERWNPSAR